FRDVSCHLYPPARACSCPWGSVGPAAPACSLTEVMSEQLARQLDEEDQGFPAPAADPEEGPDTDSDLMLAQMLQMQFDREFDDQLRREERKLNGDSKVSISFENYRKVHPYEDSDSSEDEVDWQDTRHDPYRAGRLRTEEHGPHGQRESICSVLPGSGCRHGNQFVSLAQFAPEVHVGDGLGMDLKLSNQVFNSLKQHCYSEQRRSARLHEKKEHSTAEQAVDPRTRLLMYKMVNSGVLENINGCISTGKESVVFHADGGSLEEQPVPEKVVLKVFKTTLNEFKNRDRYIKDDYRFKERFSKLNPRKVIRLWAEKEMHNLARMKKAGIPCPDVVLLKKHILVMSFIGKEHVPAPKLKDVALGAEEAAEAYRQVLQLMQLLYQDCNLVHADLSEYNMLWYQGKVRPVFLVLFRSAVPLQGLQERCHGNGCSTQFFQKRGVSEALSVYDLFNAVTGLNIPVSADDDARFLAEIVAMEKRNEDHVQKRGKKTFPVTLEDGGPPLDPDSDD
uniref:Serine/threonine-protein kinase RIO3 n=1 Tax=Xiphophorus couchianus TaxID=32473 RepID=A0A3B5KWG7_9TELE